MYSVADKITHQRGATLISKDKLLEKYNISKEKFEYAEISWDELEHIYYDYKGKISKYEKILSDFEKQYLGDTTKIGIHSYRTRIKDPEHLIVKIIQKKIDKYRKYQNLNKDNYEKFLTDLIGIRGFILFKEQWIDFHRYICGCFDNEERYYVKDSLEDFDEDIEHQYMAEPPKVHIRDGDNRKIYEGEIAPDQIISKKIYRSIHYILKYHGVYIEIQIRTLFEEGWGEIDHHIVYPYYKDNANLHHYTELLNRLSGLADEMGSFFCVLKKLELDILQYTKVEASGEDVLPDIVSNEETIEIKDTKVTTKQIDNTALGCISEIMKE